jgi:hypothetical protein
MILGKWPTWRTILYYVFILIFNSTCFEHIVLIIRRDKLSIQPLVTVTLCRWTSLPTCTRPGHRNRVTVTRGCVDTIFLSSSWARCARNMYRVKNKNKYIVKNCASRWSFTKNNSVTLFSGSSETFINIVERHLSGLIGTMSHPDMQKIRIIGFLWENRLHWQFESGKRILQTAVGTFI